jgi:uncharacterized protein
MFAVGGNTAVTRRRKDDHLSFVAGLSARHTVEINNWNILTLEKFAQIPIPLQTKPSRGSSDTYEEISGTGKGSI